MVILYCILIETLPGHFILKIYSLSLSSFLPPHFIPYIFVSYSLECLQVCLCAPLLKMVSALLLLHQKAVAK